MNGCVYWTKHDLLDINQGRMEQEMRHPRNQEFR